MITFTLVQCLLHVTAKSYRVNIVEQVKAANNIIVLPQGALGSFFASIRVEFVNYDGLRSCLQGEGNNNPLDVFPFGDNQLFVDFPNGPEQPIWMFL